MKIMHLCLSCFYIDDRAYQENELIEEHAKQGHEVLVVASTQVHDEEGRAAFTEPGLYYNENGVEVIRLPYHPLIPKALAKSLRVHKGVYQILEGYSPDVILFHGMCGWELVTVTRYKKSNPKVKLYVDNHTDFVNSAQGFVSKWGLHFLYYRTLVHKCLPYIEKILCVSKLTEKFANEFYGIPNEKLEFYPLGGHPTPDNEYKMIRCTTRKNLELTDKTTAFIQSGKQSTQKKILETLEAFVRNKNAQFRLFIVGVLVDDIRDKAQKLIDSDNRIHFLGWKKPGELKELLCASDVYLQPGSQSSTMQTSLCCYCVPVLADIEGHEIYTKNNGWLVRSMTDIEDVLEKISSGVVDLEAMKRESKKLAKNKLDYAVLAKRILY